MSSKRSRIHPKYKTKYRVKNWAAYDKSLVARGDLTLWITPEALEAWRPGRTGRRGAQPKFSDLAIETALTLRLVFHLPLRQAEGFLRSILRVIGLEIQGTKVRRREKLLHIRAALETYPGKVRSRARRAAAPARTSREDTVRSQSAATFPASVPD